LNPHALRHMALNHACLPIPAPAQLLEYYNRQLSDVKQVTQRVYKQVFQIETRSDGNVDRT